MAGRPATTIICWLQTVGHVIDVPESGVDSFGDFPLLNLVEMVKHVGGNRIDVLVIGIGIVFSDMERLVQALPMILSVSASFA